VYELPAAAVAFGQVVAASRAAVGRLLAVGLFVGLAGSSYTLYGLLAALLVAVLAARAVLTAGPDRRAAGRRALRDVGVVAAVALVVALPVWGAFLLEAVRSGIGPNAAARFLPEGSALLPDVLGADPWRLLLTVGLLGLAARVCAPWGRQPGTLAALGITVACGYAWYALSTLALAGSTTLLAFRMESVLEMALGTAGVLVLAELWTSTAERVTARGWPARRVAVAGGLLAAVAAAQVLSDRVGDLDGRVEQAWTPTGRTPGERWTGGGRRAGATSSPRPSTG
jgi:galactan 5-O-arabinofuranosyltransferase